MKSTLLAAIAFAALLPTSASAQHHGQEFLTAKNIRWGATPTLPGRSSQCWKGR